MTWWQLVLLVAGALGAFAAVGLTVLGTIVNRTSLLWPTPQGIERANALDTALAVAAEIHGIDISGDRRPLSPGDFRALAESINDYAHTRHIHLSATMSDVRVLIADANRPKAAITDALQAAFGKRTS